MTSPVLSIGPLLASISGLSDGGIDVGAQSKSLTAGLDSLLQTYCDREKKYAEAVKSIQDNYQNIIREAEQIVMQMKAAAEEEAKGILDSARSEVENWEAEKVKLADVQKFEPRIKLDVGGSKFTTSLTTLTRFPDTMIGAMFSGRHALPLDEDGYHFIDRDGTHFRYILNFLRSPESFELDLTGSSLKELKSECDYYGILELMFPFVPVPEFTICNPWNNVVTIKQRKDGIFSVNGYPLHVCMHCFAVDYSHCGVTGHSGYFFKNFDTIVKKRNGIISPNQPKPPSTCKYCGLTQV